jgi:coproporphyrinogen III oxidase-like Fe-S oxidoreductase
MNLDIQHLMRPGTLSLAALPPLSLYVHLPWCLRKCPYCDFNSHEWRTDTTGELPETRYLDALCADVEAALPLIWGRSVHSIFIGGGTPSLFSPAAIERLISDLRARLRLVPECEITLEANPGTFEKDRFRAFRAAGVTRLSIGVQSFNDAHLKVLGRVHSREQALAAVHEAALKPPHLSIYHLTLEPNTLFAKYPPQGMPEDDDAYAMLDRITERTAQVGLQRYEVSAYAQGDHRCWHNLNYWQFGDYLGVGAGAHSKLSFAHRVIRQVRYREPKLYMDQALAGQAVTQSDEVSRKDLPFEFMLNALRLREGFELAQFSERTGLPLSAIQKALAEAEAKGLVTRDFQRVTPTERGFDFLSDLQEIFLPSASTIQPADLT